jgi:HEAT repeat protein
MLGLPPLPRTLAAALRDVRDARREVRLSSQRDLVRHARGDSRNEAIAGLVQSLVSDEDPDVRAEAAVALADANAHEALDALLEAAFGLKLRVRQMALLALGEVAPQGHAEVFRVLESAWRAPEAPLRFQALVALHHVGAPLRDGLLFEALVDDDPEVRAMAFRIADECWAETALPDDVLEQARSGLTDPSPGVRLCAALLLGGHGNTDGASVLLQAVDGSLGVGTDADRQAAVEMVGRLRVPGAARALNRCAFGPFGARRDSLAWHARVALAKLGDQRAKDAILRGLRAWTRDGRTLAVVAAGFAGLTEAKAAILAMRGDPQRADPDAVTEALEALAGRRDAGRSVQSDRPRIPSGVR